MSQQSNSRGGTGFLGLLQILFIGLKLGQVIDWSWIWVLSPLLFSFGLTVVLLVIAAAAFLVSGILRSRDKK